MQEERTMSPNPCNIQHLKQGCDTKVGIKICVSLIEEYVVNWLLLLHFATTILIGRGGSASHLSYSVSQAASASTNHCLEIQIRVEKMAKKLKKKSWVAQLGSNTLVWTPTLKPVTYGFTRSTPNHSTYTIIVSKWDTHSLILSSSRFKMSIWVSK